jgi:hypothetical protein
MEEEGQEYQSKENNHLERTPPERLSPYWKMEDCMSNKKMGTPVPLV